jgi:archaellum component FlaC
MLVTNTSERRLSMAQFIGLFLAAVTVSCFAFTRSFSLQEKIPQEELSLLREKQKVMEKIAETTTLLPQFEMEKASGTLQAAELDTKIYDKMSEIRRELYHKDTLTSYSDAKKILTMTTQYYYSIRKTSKEGDLKVQELNKQITDLQQQIQMGAIQAVAAKNAAPVAPPPAPHAPASGGGGAAAAPNVVYMPAPASAAAPASAPVPANCDAAVSQVKGTYQRGANSMRPAIAQIRNNLNNIKCLIGGNKAEKTSIEGSLKQIESQIDFLSN